jgi:hypothetical protein
LLYFEEDFLDPSFMAARSYRATVAIGYTGRNHWAVEYKININIKGLSGMMVLATAGVADGYRI